jgi:hypothetical protein
MAHHHRRNKATGNKILHVPRTVDAISVACDFEYKHVSNALSGQTDLVRCNNVFDFHVFNHFDARVYNERAQHYQQALLSLPKATETSAPPPRTTRATTTTTTTTTTTADSRPAANPDNDSNNNNNNKGNNDNQDNTDKTSDNKGNKKSTLQKPNIMVLLFDSAGRAHSHRRLLNFVKMAHEMNRKDSQSGVKFFEFEKFNVVGLNSPANFLAMLTGRPHADIWHTESILYPITRFFTGDR